MFKYSELRKQHITYIQLRGAHLFHRLSPPHAWYHIPEGTSLERRLLCFVSLTIAFPCRELLLQIVKLFRSHRLHYLEQPFLLSWSNRQVVKSQLRHDYTASSPPFPRFRKFDAFPFPLQFRNSARNSGIPRFTIGHSRSCTCVLA